LPAALAFPIAPAPAQSASATITRISPTSGAAGVLVSVDGTGCITPGGQPVSTAELFVRGPGASTNRVGPVSTGLGPTPFAVGLAGGAFLGLVPIPADASTGATYKLSAQCIAQGQPLGPESAGVIFTVTGPAPPPRFDTGMGTGTGTGTGTGSNSGTRPTTGAVTGQAGLAGGATTGRATPIPAQPRFTG